MGRHGPTIPLRHRTPGGDGHGGGYPANAQRPSRRTANSGEDGLSPEPDSADAAEDFILPQAAPPAHGPGKWLRGLIGVDESLLDRLWEERARYTGLGAIVLGTATMAALSMLDALDQIFGPVWPVLVLVALFWGVSVLRN